MSSLIGILSLLSALAATSYALSCTQCTSASSICLGSSVTCQSGQLCGSSYTEAIAGGKITEGLVRSCAFPSECDFYGSMSLKQLQSRTVSSCCSTDNCTPTLPALPRQNSILNGQVCRSCVSTDSTWCYTDDTIQCTGDETMCLLQTAQISGSVSASTAFRGCATKSYCDLGSQSSSVAGTNSKTKNVCTNGGISVHKIVLTPAVVCLLLLKLFF